MYLPKRIDRRKTPQRELAKILKEVRCGLNPYKDVTTYSTKLLTELKPALVQSFLQCIKSRRVVENTSGKLSTIPDGLRLTVSHFTFNQTELKQLLNPNILQHKSYLHKLMEERFKIWVAQGNQDSYLNAYTFAYNLQRLGQFDTISCILGCIFYIDEYSGVILKYKTRYENIVDIIVDAKWYTVDIVLSDGSIKRVIHNRQLLGDWVVGDKENTPKNSELALSGEINTYRKVEVKPTKSQLALNPNLKTFNMRSSHMISISSFGFEIAKHLLGSAALLSVYCKDKNTHNLSKENISLICKSENTKNSRKNEWHYNWVDYEERLIQDRIRESDKKYYIQYDEFK